MSALLKVLPSGLRVAHRHVNSPLASVYLWFDAGTVDEREGLEGAAHLLEHMLFKGTDSYGVGECAAAIESMGGDLNAYTTWDQTVLHATVLQEHWQRALQVLAEMAWKSRLDPAELELERPVVLEEIRGYDEDPGTLVDDTATSRRFPKHPYGVPVLGTAETVSGISHADLVGFWKRNYGASRCVLGVAGPMQPEDVEQAAQSVSAHAFPGEARSPCPPIPPGAKGFTRLDSGSFDTPIVNVSFAAPGDSDGTDLAALEVLTNALGSGRASVLQSELRIKAALCSEVWASLYTRRDAGTLDLGLVPARGKTQEALGALWDLVEDVKRGRLSDIDVTRARNNVLSDLKFSGDTVDGLAHELVWFTGRLGSPEARIQWMSDIANVDAQDVVEAARRWLIDPDTVVLDPDPDPVRLPQAGPATPHGTLEAGGIALHISGQEDGWALQGRMAAITLASPGGRLYETPATAGLTPCWATMLTTGAGPWNSVQLAAEFDALSATITAIAGRNTQAVQLTVPAVNLRPALELLRTVVLEPRFDTDEWTRIRNEALFDLETLSDRPDEVLSRRLWKLAWPGHPWGLARTRTTLRALSTQKLRQHHQRALTRHGLAIGVAGNVDPVAVAAGLAPLIEGLPEGEPLPPRPPAGTVKPGLFTSRAGQDQAVLAVAMRTGAIGHTHEAALRIASSLLSAQSGRLFLALRERESLAYSLWCRVWEGLDGGMFALGLGTDTARWAKARKGLLREFETLRDQGPSPEELARTLTMELGQHAMGQQRAPSRSLHLALCAIYGKPSHLDDHRKEIRSITAADVQAALAALPEPVIAVVRPG